MDATASRSVPFSEYPGELRRDVVLARVARALIRQGGLQGGADRALEELSALYESSSIGIWILSSPDTLRLVAYGAPDVVPVELQQAFRAGYGEIPAGDLSMPGPRAMSEGSALWLSTDDPAFPPHLREFLRRRQERVKVLLALPVMAHDEVIGCAVATFPDPDPLPDEEIKPLKSALGLLAILSENERLRIQDERQRQYRRAAIGDVAAEVAHEVNNPLQGILSLAELLLSDPSTAAVEEDLSLIMSEAQRAAAILGNLLNFASPEEPEPELVDVGEIAREIAALKKRPFSLAKIRFDLDIPADCPRARVTPAHLRQVLHNLASNARQAIEENPDGGEIRLHVHPRDGGVEIAMQDTGPGLPPQVQERLFDPFFTTKAEGKGTGLGLAVSRGLVEANGGRITAENWGHPSVEGGEDRRGGALFRIWLPAEEPVQGPPAPAVRRPSDPAALVVDDEPVIASVLERYLGRRGYQVERAHTGADALAKLGAGRQYELVLVDIRMPGMTGVELFTALEELYPDLVDRVVFMSGDVVTSEARTFLQTVNRPALAKPFTLERLDEVVRAVNGRGPREGGA